jgi:hypothetical protein
MMESVLSTSTEKASTKDSSFKRQNRVVMFSWPARVVRGERVERK